MAGLGIYDYGARFYSPKLGRFLSADSIVPGVANPQALNRYSYVLGNPIRYNDPTGHMCSDPEDPTPSCDGSGTPPPNSGGGTGNSGGGNGSGGGGGDAEVENGTDPDLCRVFGEGCGGGGKPMYSPVHNDGCQFPSELQYLCQLPQDAQDQIIDQIISSDGEYHPIVVDETAAMIFDVELSLLEYLVFAEIAPLAIASVFGIASFAPATRIIGVTVAVVDPLIPYKFERPPGTAEGDIVVRIGSNAPPTRGLSLHTDIYSEMIY